MLQVFTVRSNYLLKRYLKKHDFSGLKTKYYHGDSDRKMIHLLEQNGFQRTPEIKISREKQDLYLRDYIDAMGCLTDWNGADIMWWSTHLASKNRFLSPLATSLPEMIKCMEILDLPLPEQSCLIFISPSWPIIKNLKHLEKNIKYYVETITWPLSNLLSKWKDSYEAIIKLAKDIVLAFYQILRAGTIKWGKDLCLANKDVYLIKSFSYLTAFQENGYYRDPFFPTLSDRLKKRNEVTTEILTVALAANHAGLCIKKMRTLKNENVVPLEHFINFSDIVRGAAKILKYYITKSVIIKKNLYIGGHDMTCLFKELASRTGKHISLFQFLHYYAAKNIGMTYNIKDCAISFEGNPWEKMFVAGLREDNKKINIVGYQHSVVPQSSAGVFLSPEECNRKYIPDVVLTTGVKTSDILKKYGSPDAMEIKPSCALRYDYLFKLNPVEFNHNEAHVRILVALEGVWETKSLLSYSLDQMDLCKNYDFIVRTHPILPLDKLLKRIGWRGPLPANLKRSDSLTINDEVRKCDIVLYWGTTVALEALMLGRPVIHFNRGDVFSYDPLFDLDDFKWIVHKHENLEPVLQKISNLQHGEYQLKAENARAYIKSYFLPVDDRSISLFEC